MYARARRNQLLILAVIKNVNLLKIFAETTSIEKILAD